MFFTLLALTFANKQACICDHECHPSCSDNIFIASSNLTFDKFISQYNNEESIDLIFYSKQDKFSFSIDSSIFGDTKTTIRVLSQSHPIEFKIKLKTQLLYKTVEVQPGHKMILPNLTPFPSSISSSKKNILASPLSSEYPISVSMFTMKRNGTSDCSTGPNTNNLGSHPITYWESVQGLGCSTNLVSASHCGIRCWSATVSYEYTFKGVQFAIYGTKDSGHRKFDVELDGCFLYEVNEEQTSRVEYTVLYTSELLEYREHTVKIVPKGMVELYKLVYWPSINSRRLNSTELTLSGSSWKSETDGIGGIRHYKEGDSNAFATIPLNCSRFRVYGLKDDNIGMITFSYHNISHSVNCYSAQRKEGVLLYESPDLDIFNITLKISSPGTLMVSYIYYDEPPIPVSVSITQMDYKNNPQCGYYTSNSLASPNENTVNLGCPTNNLDKPAAYSCGIKCWGDNAQYRYTFKGVKFALYGTYNSGHHEIDVELDGQVIATVNEGKQGLIGPQLLYESHYLQYGEHTVGYLAKNNNNEFYKLVYWPSLNAKRLNVSQFTKKKGSWSTESDGIGGIRQYLSPGQYVSIRLRCTKFWLYGVKAQKMGPLIIRYNGNSFEENFYSDTRKEGTLLYESIAMDYSDVLVTLHPQSGNLNLNCIYYEEPAKPMITPIPISIDLPEMYEARTEITECGIKGAGNKDINLGAQNRGCDTNNLESENAYQCGLVCWGKGMRYNYAFKGVKFAVYGTISTDFGSSIIKIDNKKEVEIYQYGERQNFVVLYESDVFPYGEHSVSIRSKNPDNQLYEIYKLVFWPSLKVRRLNSTVFDKTGTWDTESDGIGGLRQYSVQNGSVKTGSFTKTFSTSKIWLYGSTFSWGEGGMEVSYNGYHVSISQKTDDRHDCVRLVESAEMPYKEITLFGETLGISTLSCVYYTYEPEVTEYINKTFKTVLPYFDILVTADSIINEISGCNFIEISENFDHYIRLDKEILFYNNIFSYNLQHSDPPGPLNINYAGKVTITNCTFKNAKCKSKSYGGILLFSSSYISNIVVQECEFINCGSSVKNVIIEARNAESSLKLENSTFRYDNSLSGLVCNTHCSDFIVNNCSFYNSSHVSRQAPKGTLAEKTLNFVLTNCVFDSCKGIEGCKAICYYIEFTRQANIEIRDNVFCNIKNDDFAYFTFIIDANNIIDQLELRNLTFINNSGKAKVGGGSGIMLRQVPYAIFVDCKFINNEARQSPYLNIGDLNSLNGDGGGVHIGLYCDTVDSALKFDGCVFKDNKAHKHGGALAIQTFNTVEIVDCIFDSNKANYPFGATSADLLFENHFDKKNEGRGGAIYINPTFQYHPISGTNDSCFDFNSYMISVSIKNCLFDSNSAHDGYGIYVEGDDGGTTFDIKTNNFTNNYKCDPVDDNDINISIRGIIASEIHTIPNSVNTENVFYYDNQRIKPLNLVYVDHYGNRIPTYVFTQTEDFSYSNDFSNSVSFTYSSVFSDSKYFSNSIDFTYSSVFSDSNTFPTSKFTESIAFSHSDKFSESSKFSKSDSFTDTKDFSKSQDFSKSHYFSGSKEFSKTKQFSESQLFSKSSKFSNSGAFSGSLKFSNSAKFSETRQFTTSAVFTQTEGFTKTKSFSESQLFSESNKFSNSDEFSKSKYFTNSDKFSESKQFSSSAVFSETQGFSKSLLFSQSEDFTKSKNFSPSTFFSNSRGFTETGAFSNTVKFSETQDFTISKKFSESKDFTKSKNFSPSTGFSNSKGFTETGVFSNTGKFSETQDFTISKKFSESKDFTRSKNFSPSAGFSNSKGFTETGGFSNTVKFSETQDFTISKKFSESKDFTKSKNFSPSAGFSNSKGFTKTGAFSSTGKFSETQDFTISKKFSESRSFSDSYEFSSSKPFSKSKPFSRTGDFSLSKGFSNTELFTLTGKFTYSNEFSQTRSFSNTGDFTNSFAFSNSKKFSETSKFSVSNNFSPSHPYSESVFFTASTSFTPEFIEEPSCIITANDLNITLYRCDYNGNQEDILVRIIKTNFTDYFNESDGGAVLITNCGFECNGVNFTECVSLNGGGGGIYIKNWRPLKYNITFNATCFTRCEAAYGGACYIYSSSDMNEVLFEYCSFNSNSITNKNTKFFGGSSLFLSSRNGNVNFCCFNSNKGRFGSIKIYNKFDDDLNRIKKLEDEEDDKNSFSIKNCDFDEKQESSSMIYYVGGKVASDVVINDCNFKGKLDKGSHYIEGRLLEKDKKKLQVKSCKFDSKSVDPVNIELVNDFIEKEVNVDLSSNLINFKEKTIMRSKLYFFVFSVPVFLAILYLKKMRLNNDEREIFIKEEL